MKKILLLLLVTNFCFAQNAIEIRLVSANIGGVDMTTMPNWIQSTDVAMNTILQNNNVYNYEYKEGHPLAIYNQRIIQVIGNPNNYANLLNDLLAYNTVVESAQYTTQYGGFSDAAYSKLVNLNVGIPLGVNSNNIINTNDTGLNQIFLTHNVIYYQQVSPSSTNPEILKTYAIACNCNSQLLRNDLNAYNTVINSTEPFPAAYLLGSKNFISKNTNIYPNPFQDKITIETDLTIKNYSVIDLIGKKIIETDSKEILNTELVKLNTGTYLLQLQSEDNTIITKKLIKK